MNPHQPKTGSVRPPPLLRFLHSEGLSLAGVVSWPLNDTEEAERQRRRAALETWLSKGYQGQMTWLEKHKEAKFSPQTVLPGCRSILVVALNYYRENTKPPPFPAGRVARYARGRDYHKELGRRLKRIARDLSKLYPGESFRAFTDAGPLHEVWLAEKAGLVFTGKNTLGIHNFLGSWLFLGHILSTVNFPPTVSSQQGACPQNCQRCLNICPTGALEAPYRINAARCLSYLTIEHRGPFDEDLRPLLGDMIFGCDLCQEVCPLNYRREITEVKSFLQDKAGTYLNLEKILRIETQKDFVAHFAGSPLMRTGREGLIRNACTVAANIKAWELLPLLQKLASDPDPGIREHAQWGIRQKDLENV